jgi:hypothetical protein
VRVRADDDDDLVDWSPTQVVEDHCDKWSSPKLCEQLPAPEPTPAARGEHDRRYAGWPLHDD